MRLALDALFLNNSGKLREATGCTAPCRSPWNYHTTLDMASNNESKYSADGSVSDLSGLNTRYHRFLDNIGKFTFKNLDLFEFLFNNFT